MLEANYIRRTNDPTGSLRKLEGLGVEEISDTATSINRQHDSNARPLVIIDASNVAFDCSPDVGRASMKGLLEVLENVRAHRLEVVAIADASLRHRLHGCLEYETLVRSKQLIQAPAGRQADVFMVNLARKRIKEQQRVFIVTNDMLKPWPDVNALRITFLRIGEREILFDPVLEEVASQCEVETREHTGIEAMPNAGVQWKCG